jgi:hypothetical protein
MRTRSAIDDPSSLFLPTAYPWTPCDRTALLNALKELEWLTPFDEGSHATSSARPWEGAGAYDTRIRMQLYLESLFAPGFDDRVTVRFLCRFGPPYVLLLRAEHLFIAAILAGRQRATPFLKERDTTAPRRAGRGFTSVLGRLMVATKGGAKVLHGLSGEENHKLDRLATA